MGKIITFVVLVGTLASYVGFAQSAGASFEVVSVKLNTTGDFRATSTTRSGRFVATNYTLRRLIQFAYSPLNRQLMNAQIIGGPGWLETDRFDVEARAGNDTVSLQPAAVRLMVQSLLQDRFQLKLQRETRELAVYDLVVVRPGRMKLSEDQTPPDPIRAPGPPPAAGMLARGAFGIVINSSGLTLTGTAIPMSTFVDLLQSQVDRPVVDKTNLDGLFDVRLEFARGANVPAPGPDVAPLDQSGTSVFTALQEQLGLRLDGTKAPVEVLVIDGAHRPSAN